MHPFTSHTKIHTQRVPDLPHMDFLVAVPTLRLLAVRDGGMCRMELELELRCMWGRAGARAKARTLGGTYLLVEFWVDVDDVGEYSFLFLFLFIFTGFEENGMPK